ncbi:hypothetical protein CPB86DRAFT_826287 [Serendipita vermifera]|nr:hypothetical protein CPB86DRAFT_826287 [Serendipita vermifera]
MRSYKILSSFWNRIWGHVGTRIGGPGGGRRKEEAHLYGSLDEELRRGAGICRWGLIWNIVAGAHGGCCSVGDECRGGLINGEHEMERGFGAGDAASAGGEMGGEGETERERGAEMLGVGD